MNRRRFMQAGLATLGASQLHRMATAETPRAPARLLIVHKPIATIPAQYDCAGSGRDFTLSPILEPFADLREQMTIVEGLDILKKPNTPLEDHGNAIVTAMTGGIPFKPAGSDIAVAERASIDQLLARGGFAGDTPIRSLQLAADVRSNQLFTRVLAYAGHGQPMPPEGRPLATYAQVFGTLADPVLDAHALRVLRARKQSVLDFARGNLARIAPRLGGPERERLDRHVQAIRETEQLLDRTAGFDTTVLRDQVSGVDITKLDENHGAIGRAQLELVRAAFQCDLTRVATFGWACGQTVVNFSRIIPGLQDLGFHALTHAGGNHEHDEAAIHRWYNEQFAGFLRSMRDTPDRDGRSLLDNTLVVVWSEMRLGIHTFDNVPIQVFGGANLGHTGGRLIRYGNRPTNDMWLAIANQFGLPLTCFGDAERCTGPLPGLFDARPWTLPEFSPLDS